MKTLNERYAALSAVRRYEVWFLRLGLCDFGGAWWFRYLLVNPGRSGCPGNERGLPVQVWATWFPPDGKPQTFVQGFPLSGLDLSPTGKSPFHLRIADNGIGENSCRGAMDVDGHRIAWDLQYCSTFRATLSNKGWIGFSRTPHSDARFSGYIVLDSRRFQGDPLGFGVQGHNSGYRHRGFWIWAHAHFLRAGQPTSTIEALVYDMPMGLVFRRAVLWHEGESLEFRKLREMTDDSREFDWSLSGSARNGVQLQASFDGTGPGRHHLPYLKTDCSGTFDVVNNSLAKAMVQLKWPTGRVEELRTSTGAVLEMAGHRNGQPLRNW